MHFKGLCDNCLDLAAGAVSGLIYQSYMQARDAETYPPPDKLYDVAGISTHMICEGQGEPWLMMEGGLRSDITAWAGEPEIGHHTDTSC